MGKGKKNVSVKFRVFGKKEGNWKKSFEKNQSVLGKKKEDFSKFVFTSWALC